MKFSLVILLLLLTYLVALPTDTLRACGSGGECQKTVSSNANGEQVAAFGEPCVENSPCNDCPPDSDGCGHCHCPDCGTTGAHTGFCKNTSNEVFPARAWLHSARAVNFYYKAPNSSAHLTALFQPPRV